MKIIITKVLKSLLFASIFVCSAAADGFVYPSGSYPDLYYTFTLGQTVQVHYSTSLKQITLQVKYWGGSLVGNLIVNQSNSGQFTWTIGENDNVTSSLLATNKNSNEFVLIITSAEDQDTSGLNGFVNGALSSRGFYIDDTTSSSSSSSSSNSVTTATPTLAASSTASTSSSTSAGSTASMVSTASSAPSHSQSGSSTGAGVVISPTSASTSSSETPTSTLVSPGLDVGAKAGIGAGVAVAAILFVAAIVFFLLARRRRERDGTHAPASLVRNPDSLFKTSQPPILDEDYQKFVGPVISQLKAETAPHCQNVELGTEAQPYYQRYAELDVQERELSELDNLGPRVPSELGNNGKGVRSELSGEGGRQ